MSYASAATCYEAIICPRCSSVSIVKNGKTAQRKQRYSRKDRRRQFIRNYNNLGRIGALRELVVPLTINGAGVRGSLTPGSYQLGDTGPAKKVRAGLSVTT